MCDAVLVDADRPRGQKTGDKGRKIQPHFFFKVETPIFAHSATISICESKLIERAPPLFESVGKSE